MLRNLKFLHNFFPVNQLINLTSQKVLLPFYHTISNRKLEHICNLYDIRSEKLFEEDIDYLCKYFMPVSMNDLYDVVYQNKRVSKPILHISFDDGLSEIYSIVAPVLEKKGIPATFFINTDFIDNQALFYRFKVSIIIEKYKNNKKRAEEISKLLNVKSLLDKNIYAALYNLTFNDLSVIESVAKILGIDFKDYLLKEQPYLSTGQVFDLLNKRFTIGSHSKCHPFFKDINLEERKKQIVESFEFLKLKFDIRNYYFSFPFSDKDIGVDFLQWMYHDQNCKLSFGTSGLKKDFYKYHLHRIPFDRTLKPARDIIKSEYLYYIVKAFFNRNTYKRT